MFTVRFVSRALLLIEFLVLIIPSGLALIVFTAFFSADDFNLNPESFVKNFICVLAFSTFVAFWQLYYQVMREKFSHKKISVVTAVLTFMGFSMSVLTLFLDESSLNEIFVLFKFGNLYAPTYLHMIFEMNRQTSESCPFAPVRNTE